MSTDVIVRRRKDAIEISTSVEVWGAFFSRIADAAVPAGVLPVTRLIALSAFCAFALTRLALLLYTGPFGVPVLSWPGVLVRGLFFDAATLAYLLPAAAIVETFAPRALRRLRLPLFSITFFLLFFLAAAEFVFWMEFQTRFNFIALDYLIYTNEVFRNIWESYPIVWILSVVALASTSLAWATVRWLGSQENRTLSAHGKGRLLFVATLLPLLSARFVGVESLTQSNAFAEELSGNGLFTLAAAARRNELDYDKFYATIPQEKADAILRDLDVEWTSDAARRNGDTWKRESPESLPPFLLRRPKNVVLISVESLSAKYVGVYGSTEGLTPSLDRLAGEGLMFERAFATGTRTVRGLEALALSTPPIPGQAIIRRPRNAHLASLGEMLNRQSVLPFFLYGGRGYFDNMNAFFSANRYTVRDRASIHKADVVFENAWGVADEVLFGNALRTLDEAALAKKPAFVHVMTTSNHRPYTYPDGRIDIPSPGGRRGAVKYSDYAIGRFIDDARAKPWFKDTLFVIVADHCASVAGRTELPVADYRIPLIFYAPELVKPGRIERMISQIDIAPTILKAMGKAGSGLLFGKNLSGQTGAPRAFISNYQNLGYYKSDQLIVLKPKMKVDAFRVDPETLESTPTKPDPALVEEAIAYYQTSSRAFKNGQLELSWK